MNVCRVYMHTLPNGSVFLDAMSVIRAFNAVLR